MNISVDAGALCAPYGRRLGTGIFTTSLMEALQKYDKKNAYFFYSFCKKPADVFVQKKHSYKVLLPKQYWMTARVSAEEFFHQKDIFLGLNQVFPFFTKAKRIGFSHGLSFLYYKHLYKNDSNRLEKQLHGLVKKSSAIIVSSHRVTQEFRQFFPGAKHIFPIPFGIPFDMLQNTRVKKREKFFLFVGEHHPIKNIGFLIDCFGELTKDTRFADYKLILVSTKKIKTVNKNILSYSYISRNKLQKLYQTASCYISASLYESFNFPVLEALSQNCSAVGLESAIIPEMAEFVSIAKNKKEFVEKMKRAVLQKKSVDREKLKQQFSWETYVRTLMGIMERI